MTIKQMAAEWIRRFLASRGYVLARLENANHSMSSALQAAAAREHPVRTIVDVGASDGRWSELAMIYFPNCKYLLIEAQEAHREALTRYNDRHQNADFIIAAASSEVGQIYFKANRPFGGQASRRPFQEYNTQIAATTIDTEIHARGLSPPFLLKFDTHGFEPPILAGAKRTLDQTELIVMECYNFRISPECLLFHEMCEKLGHLGFRCIDLANPRYRPRDGSFWQADMFFARATRKEFSYTKFR